jgi:hypothetical protein
MFEVCSCSLKGDIRRLIAKEVLAVNWKAFGLFAFLGLSLTACISHRSTSQPFPSEVRFIEKLSFLGSNTCFYPMEGKNGICHVYQDLSRKAFYAVFLNTDGEVEKVWVSVKGGDPVLIYEVKRPQCEGLCG